MYPNRKRAPSPQTHLLRTSDSEGNVADATGAREPVAAPDFIGRFAPLCPEGAAGHGAEGVPAGTGQPPQPLWVPVQHLEQLEADALARRAAEQRAVDRARARLFKAAARKREKEAQRESKRRQLEEGKKLEGQEADKGFASAHQHLGWAKSTSPAPDIKWPSLTRSAAVDLTEHAERLVACVETWPGWDVDAHGPQAGYIKVFDPATLGEFLTRVSSAVDLDVRVRGAQLYRALCERGPMRRVGLPAGLSGDLPQPGHTSSQASAPDNEPPDSTALDSTARGDVGSAKVASAQAASAYTPAQQAVFDNDPLAELRASCPHMSEVIDFVSDFLRKAARTGQPQRIPPILLLGGPGVGKTYFAHELARLLGVPMHRVAMDQSMADFFFMGSDVRWGNTESGLIFDALIKGEAANPVVVLDELDKANGTARSALNPLHTLLEVNSSCSVCDLSVGLTMDASYITWIATANYERWIPPTLHSRFRVFRIEQPKGEQAIRATESVARAIVAKNPGLEPIPRRVVVEMAHLSTREVHLSLERVVARVMARGASRVRLSDLLPSDLGMEDTADAWGSESPGSKGQGGQGGQGGSQGGGLGGGPRIH